MKLITIFSFVISSFCWASSTDSFKVLTKELEKVSSISYTGFELLSADYRLFELDSIEFDKLLGKVIEEDKYGLSHTEVFKLTEQEFLAKIKSVYLDSCCSTKEKDIQRLLRLIQGSFDFNFVKAFNAGKIIDGKFWRETTDSYYFSISTLTGTVVFKIQGVL